MPELATQTELRADLRKALLEAHAIILATGTKDTDQAIILAGIWVKHFGNEPIE